MKGYDLFQYIYEVRDPLEGMILLNKFEYAIYKNRVLQRLREIKQLGLTNLIYPSATCNRLSHSLGVLNTASKLVDCVYNNSDQDNLFVNYITTHNEKLFCQLTVRLMGLIHDAGIGPLSHASDIFLEKENHADSLEQVFGFCTEFYQVVKSYVDSINNYFNSHISIAAIIDLLKKAHNPNNNLHNFLSRVIVGDNNIPFDADRIDYLNRDSYYCGVKYGKFDRARFLQQLHYNGDDNKEFFYVKVGAIPTVEQFLLSRYYLFYQIYFHKKRAIIDDFIQEIIRKFLNDHSDFGWNNSFKMNENFLELVDSKIECYIIENKDNDFYCEKLYKSELPKCYLDLPGSSTWDSTIRKKITDEINAKTSTPNINCARYKFDPTLSLIPFKPNKNTNQSQFCIKFEKDFIPFEKLSLIGKLCVNEQIDMYRLYDKY